MRFLVCPYHFVSAIFIFSFIFFFIFSHFPLFSGFTRPHHGLNIIFLSLDYIQNKLNEYHLKYTWFTLSLSLCEYIFLCLHTATHPYITRISVYWLDLLLNFKMICSDFGFATYRPRALTQINSTIQCTVVCAMHSYQLSNCLKLSNRYWKINK